MASPGRRPSTAPPAREPATANAADTASSSAFAPGVADLERDRDRPAGEETDVSDAPQVKGNRLDPWLDNYAARAHGLRASETRSLQAISIETRNGHGVRPVAYNRSAFLFVVCRECDCCRYAAVKNRFRNGSG